MSEEDRCLAPSPGDLSRSGKQVNANTAEMDVAPGPGESSSVATKRHDIYAAAAKGLATTRRSGAAPVVPAVARTSPQTQSQTISSKSPWDGSFRTLRVSDSGVVQTSGEAPVNTARRMMLPVPSNPTREGLDVPQPRLPETTLESAPLPSAGGASTPGAATGENRQVAEGCKPSRALKSINAIAPDISIKQDDLTGEKHLPPDCPLGNESVVPRNWQRTTFTWTAASTWHKPIYFEDEQLERYGHTFGPVAQTAVSAVKFFGTVPLVPYYMGVYPANECIYDLGLDRPGSCSPYYIDPFPLSVRGAINEMYLGILPAL